MPADSRTAFEQYHALRAAQALANLQPRPAGTEAVVDAVQTMLSSGRFDAAGSDRGNLARHVLSLLP